MSSLVSHTLRSTVIRFAYVHTAENERVRRARVKKTRRTERTRRTDFAARLIRIRGADASTFAGTRLRIISRDLENGMSACCPIVKESAA